MKYYLNHICTQKMLEHIGEDRYEILSYSD